MPGGTTLYYVEDKLFLTGERAKAFKYARDLAEQREDYVRVYIEHYRGDVVTKRMQKVVKPRVPYWEKKNPKSRKTHGNPVRVAASMAGKSTGWMPAKAVRVVKGKGGQVRVDVKR